MKSTGKRGAQLFVGKSFPPQVMAIAGDIEIARKFCLKFNLVKEEERQLDLYLKRGQIFTKSALKPLIVSFIANAKKAGEYAEPGNHHDRLVDPILEDIKRDDEAARRKLGQGFIEERRLQDPRPNPNADRLAQSQLESQQTNLWQASPQTIQPIPPVSNVYAKNNNGRSYMQDYGHINGHISASYAQRKRTGGDPHCNTSQGRQDNQLQYFNQDQGDSRLTGMEEQFGGLRPVQGAVTTSFGGMPNEFRQQDARSVNSGSAQSQRGEQTLRSPIQFGSQGKTVEYGTPDYSNKQPEERFNQRNEQFSSQNPMAQEQMYTRHSTLNKPSQANKGLEQLYAGVQRTGAEAGRRLQMMQEPTPDGIWQNAGCNNMGGQYGTVEEATVQITPQSTKAYHDSFLLENVLQERRAAVEKRDDELSKFFVPQQQQQVIGAMTSAAEKQLQHVQRAIDLAQGQAVEPTAPSTQPPEPKILYGVCSGVKGWKCEQGFQSASPGLTVVAVAGKCDNAGNEVGCLGGVLVHDRKEALAGLFSAGVRWDWSGKVTYMQPKDLIPIGVVSSLEDIQELARCATQCKADDERFEIQNGGVNFVEVVPASNYDSGREQSRVGQQTAHELSQAAHEMHLKLGAAASKSGIVPRTSEGTQLEQTAAGGTQVAEQEEEDDSWEQSLNGQTCTDQITSQLAVSGNGPKHRLFEGASSRQVYSGDIALRRKLQTAGTEQSNVLLSSWQPDTHVDTDVFVEDKPEKFYLTVVKTRGEIFEQKTHYNQSDQKSYMKTLTCCDTTRVRASECNADNPMTVKAAIRNPSLEHSEHREILNLNQNGKQSSLASKLINVEVPAEDSTEMQRFQREGGFLKFTSAVRVKDRANFEEGGPFILTPLLGTFGLEYQRIGDKFLTEDPNDPEAKVSVREKHVMDDTFENRTHVENHTVPVIAPAIHAFATAMATIIEGNPYGSASCNKLPVDLRPFCVGGPEYTGKTDFIDFFNGASDKQDILKQLGIPNAVFKSAELLPIVRYSGSNYEDFDSSAGDYCKHISNLTTADGRKLMKTTSRLTVLVGQTPRMLTKEIFDILSVKREFIGGFVTILSGQSACPDNFVHVQMATGARGALMDHAANEYGSDQTMVTFFVRREVLELMPDAAKEFVKQPTWSLQQYLTHSAAVISQTEQHHGSDARSEGGNEAQFQRTSGGVPGGGRQRAMLEPVQGHQELGTGASENNSGLSGIRRTSTNRGKMSEGILDTGPQQTRIGNTNKRNFSANDVEQSLVSTGRVGEGDLDRQFTEAYAEQSGYYRTTVPAENGEAGTNRLITEGGLDREQTIETGMVVEEDVWQEWMEEFKQPNDESTGTGEQRSPINQRSTESLQYAQQMSDLSTMQSVSLPIAPMEQGTEERATLNARQFQRSTARREASLMALQQQREQRGNLARSTLQTQHSIPTRPCPLNYREEQDSRLQAIDPRSEPSQKGLIEGAEGPNRRQQPDLCADGRSNEAMEPRTDPQAEKCDTEARAATPRQSFPEIELGQRGHSEQMVLGRSQLTGQVAEELLKRSQRMFERSVQPKGDLLDNNTLEATRMDRPNTPAKVQPRVGANSDYQRFMAIYMEIPASDRGAVLSALDIDQRSKMLAKMDPRQEAAALAAMSASDQAATLEAMKTAMTIREQALSIMAMEYDDRLAALNVMTAEHQSTVTQEILQIEHQVERGSDNRIDRDQAPPPANQLANSNEVRRQKAGQASRRSDPQSITGSLLNTESPTQGIRQELQSFSISSPNLPLMTIQERNVRQQASDTEGDNGTVRRKSSRDRECEEAGKKQRRVTFGKESVRTFQKDKFWRQLSTDNLTRLIHKLKQWVSEKDIGWTVEETEFDNWLSREQQEKCEDDYHCRDELQKTVFAAVGPTVWDQLVQEIVAENGIQHEPVVTRTTAPVTTEVLSEHELLTTEPLLEIALEFKEITPQDSNSDIRQHKVMVVNKVIEQFQEGEMRDLASKNANLLIKGDKGITSSGVYTLKAIAGTVVIINTRRTAYIVVICANIRGLGNGSPLLKLLERRCNEQLTVKWITVTLQSCLQEYGDFFARHGFKSQGNEGECTQWTKQLEGEESRHQSTTSEHASRSKQCLAEQSEAVQELIRDYGLASVQQQSTSPVVTQQQIVEAAASMLCRHCKKGGFAAILDFLKHEEECAQGQPEMPQLERVPNGGQQLAVRGAQGDAEDTILAGMNHLQYTAVLALNCIAGTWTRKAALRLVRIWIVNANQWTMSPFPNPGDVQQMIKMPDGKYALALRKFVTALEAGVMQAIVAKTRDTVERAVATWSMRMFESTASAWGCKIGENEGAGDLEDALEQDQEEVGFMQEASRQEEEERRSQEDLAQHHELNQGPLGKNGPNYPQSGSSRLTTALIPDPKLNYAARKLLAERQEEAASGSKRRRSEELTVLSEPREKEFRELCVVLEDRVSKAAKGDYNVDPAPLNMERGPGDPAPKGGGSALQRRMWECWNKITAIANSMPESVWSAPSPPVDRGNKQENCAGVYNKGADIAKAIKRARDGNCDGSAMAALMKRQQLIAQWEERCKKANQTIYSAWGYKVITDNYTADGVIKLMAFRMPQDAYNAVMNAKELLRLPEDQKKLFTPRFDRSIPEEDDLPVPNIRLHLKIAKAKKAKTISPVPTSNIDIEETTPNQPSEAARHTPPTTANNNTDSRRGRVQQSMVMPENIQGHATSTLNCDNGTMWVDTAKSSPIVKRLKLGQSGEAQQLHEPEEGDQLKRKQKKKAQGTKRARSGGQVNPGTSSNEASQRASSAKEQVANQDGKKGMITELCAWHVSSKTPNCISSSQIASTVGAEASFSGSGLKSGLGAKRTRHQVKQGTVLPECFTPTSSRVHAELECRLTQMWDWQLPESLHTPQIFGFSFKLLESLLGVCGILENCEQAQWIKQLGNCRQTVTRTTWEVESSETSPIQLIEAAVRDGWVTCFPDGSKREIGDKKKCPAGSGVFFPLCPKAPVAFSTTARRPSSGLAELEAIMCARFIAGPNTNLLLFPDSAYTANIVNLLLPSRKGYNKAMANLPAVMLMGFLFTLASGGTHCIRIPSHQGVVYNEIADVLAKHGATLCPAHWPGFRNIDWDKMKVFLLSWGKPEKEEINRVHKLPVELRLANMDHLTIQACIAAYSQRDPRWIPNCLNDTNSWAKTQEVRELTLPFMRVFNKQLWEAWCRVNGGARGGELEKIKLDISSVMDAQRACLWSASVKIFGLRKIENDARLGKSQKHTREFDKRTSHLAKVVDLTRDIELDIAEVDYDVLNVSCIRTAIESGTGMVQPLVETNTALKACALAALIETEVGIHISDVCTLLEEAESWAEAELMALEQEDSRDLKKKRAQTPAALWRRGNIKAYLNHVRGRDCENPLICKVEPEAYLKYLVAKVCTIDCSGFDFSWLTQRPSASAKELHKLSKTFTKKEILRALLATKSKSAPNPIVQESYAGLKMLIEPRILRAYKKNMAKAAGDLRKEAWCDDAYDVCSWQWDSDIPFQRLFETNRWCEQTLDAEGDLDSQSEGNDTSYEQADNLECAIFEGSSCSIHHFIWLIAVMIQKTGWCPQVMNDMCTRVIPKVALDKASTLSPAEFEAVQNDPSKWREVQLCSSMLRKMIANVIKTRIITFIVKNNRHYGVQAGYLPRVDPSRIAHLKLNIVRTYSEMNRFSEIIIPWDLESMFTYIQQHQRERAYEFNGLPDDVQNMMKAFQVNKRAFMTREGTIFEPQSFPGDIMGSSESLADTLLLTAELCAALVHAGVGFQLPGLGRCRQITVSGIMVVDDLTTAHGGGCSAEECIADALKTCEIVCEFAKRYKLFFHGNDDPAKSKTVAIVNLFDEQGNQVYRDIKLPVFTKQGIKYIPTLQHGQAHKILGVEVHCNHMMTPVTTFQAAFDIFASRVKYLMQSDLPGQAMLYSLSVVALGKVNWLLDKGSCIPLQLALDLSKMVAKYALSIAGVSGAPCCMAFANTLDGGIGVQDPIRSLMKLAVVQVIHDKTAEEAMVRRWSWYELEFARSSNMIPEAEYDHQYGFFNWDIRGLTWREVLDPAILEHQSVHTWALAAMIRTGCRTGTREVAEGSRVKLGITDPTKAETDDLECSKQKIRKAIQSFFTAEASLEFTGTMTGAKVHSLQINRKLSNKWRVSKDLSSSAWKWAMKAMADLCITPALLCGRWKKPGSTRCPLCFYQYANLKHITQRCTKMDGMLRVRHNECFPIFSSWLAKCCSDMPYFGGFEKAPPDWMVPEDWRRRVEALTPHGTPGTKPDLIIANAVAPGKFKVRIIDFQVAFEDNLEFAKESKKRHYGPLEAVIKDHLFAENNNSTPDVKVVPIIVGARGGIPDDWHEGLALLATTPSNTAALAEKLSITAIRGSHKIYMTWLQNAYAAGWNKSNR